MFGHFGAIFGHFWPFLTIFGYFGSHRKNGCRLVMWPLKMTAREAEIQWRWFWMLLFRHSGQFWSFGAFFGHFWPFFSQFWPQTQTCRKLVMWPLKMIAREAEIQWRWFRMSLFRYSDHVRSFWAFFGHFWPLLANFGPKVKIVINWSYDHSKQSQDEQKSDGQS